MIIKFPLMKNLKVNLMCSIVFGLGFVMALGLSVAIGRPVYALLIVFGVLAVFYFRRYLRFKGDLEAREMELSNQYVSEAESEIYNGMEIRSYLVPKEKIVAHEGKRRMAVNVGLCILPVLALVACIVGSGFEIDDFYDVCESFGAFFMTAVICAIIKICTCKGIFIGKYAKSVPEKIVITFDRLIIDFMQFNAREIESIELTGESDKLPVDLSRVTAQTDAELGKLMYKKLTGEAGRMTGQTDAELGKSMYRNMIVRGKKYIYRFGMNTLDKRYDFFEDYSAMVNSICGCAVRNKVKIKILE